MKSIIKCSNKLQTKKLTPEDRAARKKAQEDAEAQQEWNNAVNAGIITAKMRAAGYDVSTPEPFPQEDD